MGKKSLNLCTMPICSCLLFFQNVDVCCLSAYIYLGYLDPRSYKFHKLEKCPYNSSNWKFAHTILYLPVSYHVLHSCILGPTYILYFPPFECITPVSILCSSPIDFLCSSFLYARTLGLPPSPFGVSAAVVRPAARCLPLPALPRAVRALQ